MELDLFIQTHQDYLNKLIPFVIKIEEQFPRPIYTKTPPFPRFEYEKIEREHVIITRLVRIISGLNAALILIKDGFIQELAVIIRTIDDFENEVYFLLEDYPNLNDNQNKFITECAKHHYDPESMEQFGHNKRDIIKKRKIHASKARMLENVANKTKNQIITLNIADVFSGYVHGTMQCIMDMYGDTNPWSEYFFKGMKGNPKIEAWMPHICIYQHSAFNVVSLVLFYLKMIKESDEVTEIRKDFEKAILPLNIDFKNKKYKDKNTGNWSDIKKIK